MFGDAFLDVSGVELDGTPPGAERVEAAGTEASGAAASRAGA
jgi:hypothetical protein